MDFKWLALLSFVVYRPYLVKSPVLTDLVHNHTYQIYTEHIWWNHQFWLTWYTIIHQLQTPFLVKSPVLTDLVHIVHMIIIQTISGEITSSDRPGTQSYISELYRTYLVKSPVLTDLIHNHTSIIETISGEITSSDWPDTQSYINYRDHIWWDHQFWLTWDTIIHQL